MLRKEGEATGLRRAKFPRRQRLRRDAIGPTWRQHPGWVRIGDWTTGWQAELTRAGQEGHHYDLPQSIRPGRQRKGSLCTGPQCRPRANGKMEAPWLEDLAPPWFREPYKLQILL